MNILILGHYEIASNYAISMAVNELLQHDLTIMLSGKGDAFEEEGNEFSHLAKYEQDLCDELNAGVDTLNLGCDGFDVLGSKTGNSIEIIAKPNSKKGLSLLKKLQPELVISIRYRKILKEAVIAIPKCGIINLHSGLLPQYRGAMAVFWAMINADKKIGSTLHYISDGTIDTGRIIATSPITCDYQETYLRNVLNLYPMGCKQIVDAVTQIQATGKVQVQAQQAKGAYYSFPSVTDMTKFKELGYKLY